MNTNRRVCHVALALMLFAEVGRGDPTVLLVTREDTALNIATAVFEAANGKENTARAAPYTVTYLDGLWEVHGYVPTDGGASQFIGGASRVVIRASDGKFIELDYIWNPSVEKRRSEDNRPPEKPYNAKAFPEEPVQSEATALKIASAVIADLTRTPITTERLKANSRPDAWQVDVSLVIATGSPRVRSLRISRRDAQITLVTE